MQTAQHTYRLAVFAAAIALALPAKAQITHTVQPSPAPATAADELESYSCKTASDGGKMTATLDSPRDVIKGQTIRFTIRACQKPSHWIKCENRMHFSGWVRLGGTDYIGRITHTENKGRDWTAKGYVDSSMFTHLPPFEAVDATLIAWTGQTISEWVLITCTPPGLDWSKEKPFAITVQNKLYNTVQMQPRYRGENTACTWQPPSDCPPYVTYLDKAQRPPYELSVDRGVLEDSAGKPFDTKDADMSHSGIPAAIFVMTKNGRLLAGKKHPVFRFHHSSLLAGGDVAAAGELMVTNGEIKEVTNCSGHYRPGVLIVEQIKDSLAWQGYRKPVEVTPCARLRSVFELTE